MYSRAKKLTVVVVTLLLCFFSMQSAEAANADVPDEGLNLCLLQYTVLLMQSGQNGEASPVCLVPMPMHASSCHSCCSGTSHASVAAMVLELIPANSSVATIRLSPASDMVANGYFSPPFRPPIG